MSLPSENMRALIWSRELLRDLITKRPAMKMKEIRERASSCLKHYPGDYIIESKWRDEVCVHGEDRRWCRECQSKESK